MESETMDPAQVFEAQLLTRHKAMNEATESGDSAVQQFYDGAVVFITGGSGFLGKQLIEKLIRATKISKVFVLLRPKKGKTVEERLSEILKEPVYDMLRQKQPDFADKIMPVTGDAAQLRLGMSHEDWNTLAEQVHIIFHMAATTRFDEPLKVATKINVRGTREAVQLGKTCKILKSFVHVSTAYSHTCKNLINTEVQEAFWPSPVDPETMIRLAESMDEERLDDITASLIKNWPNTYTFTKAVAEEIVRNLHDELPICVVRPAIVICSLREPNPGWVDKSSIYGASGLILTGGLGLMHTFLTDDNVASGLIPVDYVNNAIIVAGRETAKRKAAGYKETNIYTVTSSARNPGLWGNLQQILGNAVRPNYPTPAAVWSCFALTTNKPALFRVHFWLAHIIPAYIADGVFFMLGKERRYVKLFTKMQRGMLALSYFTLNDWFFVDNNTVELYDNLSKVDKEIFNFDVTTIDWREYMAIWFVGLRKYIIKDGLKGSEYANKKQFWFKILTLILEGLYFFFLYYIIYGFAFDLCQSVLFG